MRPPEVKYELSLDLPAAHRGVRVARHMVRHFARMEGVSNEEIEQLVLVTSELLANAIDHSAGPAAMTEKDLRRDERMKLDLVIAQREWMLTVTDEGGGDPARVQAAVQSARLPDLEDERGRGLFLMRQMVDAMEVNRSVDGRGLTFRVMRRHAGR